MSRSERQRRYPYEYRSLGPGLIFKTLSEAARPNRSSSPAWHQPVNESVNRVDVEALAKAQVERGEWMLWVKKDFHCNHSRTSA
jgi:hypothetical protein